MANSAQPGIPKDKFLMIAINLLHRQFVEAGRTRAKRLFQEIYKGRVVPITTVTMEDNSEVRFRISLDHTELASDLNFSAFSAGLSALVGNLAQALKEKRDVSVFNRKSDRDSMLFGITGVTVEDDIPRVIALGAELGGQAGAITLQLMYLDPAQFVSRRENAAGAGPA